MTQTHYDKQGIGVYVHIPFCQKKCYYCDFYSLPGCDASLIDEYCRALTAEIKMVHPGDNFVVSTIFFGGGTPSLLTARQVKTILQQLRVSLPIAKDVEITIEANPATLKLPELEQYLLAGVNRFSLGVQSFDDEELMILGRAHKAADIYETARIMYECGIKNFNLDLIYAIPGQSLKNWESNLAKAMELKPAHISAYLLQLEPETVMGRRAAAKTITLADEETEVAMYERTIDILTAHNFQQYEISNFSLPGYECQHNLSYWRSNHYLGFGAGAVSYMGNRRYINVPNVLGYIESIKTGKSPLSEELENINPRGKLADAMILGLRLVRGVNIAELNTRFNTDVMEEYNREIQDNIEKGLLIFKDGQLYLTRRGYFISNEVLCCFVA